MDQEVGPGCSRANDKGQRSEREREDPKILRGFEKEGLEASVSAAKGGKIRRSGSR